MTGMRLTRVPRRFIISISKGLSLKDEYEHCAEIEMNQNYGRVTSGTDKVEASVNPEVCLVCPHRLLLLSHVCFMLVVNEVDDGGPRVAVVDVVSKAWRVNHR